jgi:hypothetical protein
MNVDLLVLVSDHRKEELVIPAMDHATSLEGRVLKKGLKKGLIT